MNFHNQKIVRNKIYVSVYKTIGLYVHVKEKKKIIKAHEEYIQTFIFYLYLC